MSQIRHLGDITKINGAEIEPVDVITGGSPCQDLSIAGKRAGLAGERSGLFMEQIRVIKEMRENDKRNGRTGQFIRPRYMVWENVSPGVFSVNKGKDFAAVLEETIKIVEPKIPNISVPEKGWTTYGAVRDLDGRWSVAWRTLDAQYWGVPQRRRRIALVADFGGTTAYEILFIPKSVCGNLGEGETERQGITESIRTSVDISGRRTGERNLRNTDSRNESCGDRRNIAYGISPYASNAMKSSNPHSGIYEADTSRTLDNNGGNPACNQGGVAIVALEGNGSRPSHRGDGYSVSDVSYTLNTIEQHGVAYQVANSQLSWGEYAEEDKTPTLCAHGGQYGGGSESLVVESRTQPMEDDCQVGGY